MDELQAAIERYLPPGSRVHVREDEYGQCQVTSFVPGVVTQRVPFSSKLLDDDVNLPALLADLIIEST